MAQWVVGSIYHGGPTALFLVPASCSATGGVTNVVVCAIGKISTICPTPYNHNYNLLSASLNKTFLARRQM